MQRDNHSSVKSMCYSLGEGLANALCLSKDTTQVLVAGRNVFKVLSIEQDEFVEKANLRSGKNLNLNYSSNDVTWSYVDENLIATGATNGAVVLWNLSKNTRAKQEHVFSDHQRTVHKVIFHPSDPHVLFSGSQDGTVKLFDLRTKDARMTFTSNSESVRDIQFVPKTLTCFTTVNENGSVQLWDYRKGERPYFAFTAHSGPIFSCEWHPDVPNVLATAGRDKAIKVWTMTNLATLCHTIPTLVSVGRIKWRPQKKHHIGSSSLFLDASICIWDVRRPFVPFAAFEKHKDVATGIAWRNSPDIIISTSKDGTVWQHVFRDASHPASKAMPQALAFNFRRAEILQAVSINKNLVKFSSNVQLSPTMKKIISTEELFPLAESHFVSFDVDVKKLASSYGPFSIGCASEYILWGKSIPEMCEKNAQIALLFNLPQVAMTWELAKIFYSTVSTDYEPSCNLQLQIVDPVTSSPSKDNNEKEGFEKDSEEDGNNNSSSENEKQDIFSEIASGLHLTGNHSMFIPQSPPTYDFQVEPDWQVLPAEAFELRHDIKEGSPPPMQIGDCSLYDAENNIETVAIENRTSQLMVTNWEPVPSFDFTEALMEALYHHAKNGDVQTSVCVWLVLSPLDKLPVDQYSLESWCWSYVEILQKHRLYAQAALVIKHSGVLGELSQESTSYMVCCGQCGKPISRKNGNYCVRCRQAAARCSVCRGVVTGLMSWCQGCGHGGHDGHLRSWFAKNNECPAACGHRCHS